jgi:hypothetical protein
VNLKVAGVYAADQIRDRTSFFETTTQRPLRFRIAEGTRRSQ